VHRILAALGPPSSPSPRRRTLWLAPALALGLLLLAAPAAMADLLTPESGGSQNADDIDTLYKLVLVVAIIVFLGVEGALFYSLLRFRARKGAVAAQIRGNTRLEVGWTVGAAVILVVLSVITFAELGNIRTPPDSDQGGFKLADGVLTASGPTERRPPSGKSLDIDVNGQQYVWRYTYKGVDGDDNELNDPFSYEEMVVPVGTTVTLDIRGQDVAHSWWIPELGGKFDAVPGYTNYTWFKVPRKALGGAEERVFRGQCAELCGRNHANMSARVRAVSPAAFEQFLEQRKAAVKQANDLAAEAREEIEGSAEEQQP